MKLERFVDLRAGEGRPLASSALILALMVAGHTILETARDALFLSKLPPNRLTIVYAILAVLSLVVGAASIRLAKRFGRQAALVLSLLVCAYVIVLLYLRPVTPVSVFVLYVASGVMGTILMLQFWMFAGDLFSVAQGKRLFGPIGAGGVLGAAVGAGVAALVVRTLPIGVLLLAGAGLFVCAAAAVASAAVPDSAGARAIAKGPSELAWMRDLGTLRRGRYVPLVALVTALGTATVLMADYLFKSSAAELVPASSLGSFFAIFYASTNAVALVVQLFFTGAIVRRLGVTGALLVLPLLLAFGGIGAALVGTFAFALASKGADGSLRFSLHRVTSELLLLPLPTELRERTKPIFDTVFGRGVQALIAGGIFGLSAMGLATPRVLGASLGVLGVAWLVSAIAVRGPYFDLFRRALASGHLAIDSSDDLDLASVATVMESLASRDEDRVIAAMDLLADGRHAQLLPALILYHDSPRVLERALTIVATPGRTDWIPLGERLLEHPETTVRAMAIRSLAAAGHHDVALRGLSDESLEVRAYAAFFLTNEEHDRPESVGYVEEILAAPGVDGSSLRRELLAAIGDHGDARWTEVVRTIVDAEGERAGVGVTAAAAVLRTRDETLADYLVGTLSVREGRGIVHDAIAALGDAGYQALVRALLDESTPERVRLQVPRALAAFPTQAAVDLLVSRFKRERSGALRYRVLRSLGKLAALGAPGAGLRYDRSTFEAAARKNLVEHLRMVGFHATLLEGDRGTARDTPIGEVLLSLLVDKAEQSLERAFRCLQLANKNEDMKGVYSAIVGDDPTTRANALEFLDGLPGSSRETHDLLALVADDLHPLAAAQRAQQVLEDTEDAFELPTDHESAVTAMLDFEDELLAALAAYHALDFGVIRLGLRALAKLEARPVLTTLGAIPVRTKRDSSNA